MHGSLRGADEGPVTRGRRLLVLRHAKAEPFGDSDHARPLTARGHLREAGLLPDFALFSTATRTRETWAEVADASAVDPSRAVFDDALFSGSADVALDALRSAPPDATTVLFVGHNPIAEYICHFLDDGEGDPAAVSDLLHGFPPAALAVLQFELPWSELAAETGRVVGYYVGRS
jgi:phosphohistidine phosphatase